MAIRSDSGPVPRQQTTATKQKKRKGTGTNSNQRTLGGNKQKNYHPAAVSARFHMGRAVNSRRSSKRKRNRCLRECRQRTARKKGATPRARKTIGQKTVFHDPAYRFFFNVRPLHSLTTLSRVARVRKRWKKSVCLQGNALAPWMVFC